MIEYIKGTVTKLQPAYAVLEQGEIGYLLHISIFTCERLKEKSTAKLFVHEVIREDVHELFGFINEQERDMFRLLISVSGVGANTARVILSKLSTKEITYAIKTDNVTLIQGVKGIGAKTAQRLIIELRDKVGSTDVSEQNVENNNNTLYEEALTALVMLGFTKKSVENVLKKILKDQTISSSEEVVKLALRQI